MCTEEMQMVLGVIISLLDILNFLIPVILIIFCTIDIFKIIVSKKEDEIKKLRKDVMMKIIYAVIIYLVPFLVPFFLKIVNNLLPMNYDDSWQQCWNTVKESKKIVNN